MSGTINLQIGGALELILRQPPPPITVIVTAHYRDFTVRAQGDHMAYTLPSGMCIDMQVSYVDAAGNPATVDGLVSWASSDATVATAAVDAADSTKCLVSAIGPVGSAQVTATADADIGAGVRSLVTLLDVSVVAGEAVAGTIAPIGDAVPIG